MPKYPRYIPLITFALLCVVLSAPSCSSDEPGAQNHYSSLAHPGDDGRLVRPPYNEKGDRLLDFSYCGYMGGGVKIPDVATRVTLRPDDDDDDDQPRIQRAIEKVANMPPDRNGFGGAVLLEAGRYEVGRTIRIRTGGVVLRGRGAGEGGTVLIATANEPGDLIVIAGKTDPPPQRREIAGTRRKITDDYVPVAARSFTVEAPHDFAGGDKIAIVRNTNQKWVRVNDMDKITRSCTRQWALEHPDRSMVVTDASGNKRYLKKMPWSPGPREQYERTVTGVDGGRITVDVPLAEKIAHAYGGGWVYKYEYPGRIARVGVERLRCVSPWKINDNGRDDRQHFDFGIKMYAVENSWLSDLVLIGFYNCAVNVQSGVKHCTIQDIYIRGVPHQAMNTGKYYGGGGVHLSGQMNLVQRCYARMVRHYGYVVGSAEPGPNVFLHCDGQDSAGFAETHHRWSTGVLWDNMGLRNPTNVGIFNRWGCGSGHGWTTDNSVIWNHGGGQVQVESPPTGRNWAVGCKGEKYIRHGRPYRRKDPHSGYLSWGRHVAPRSLYLRQLEDRLGPKAVGNIATERQINATYDQLPPPKEK